MAALSLAIIGTNNEPLFIREFEKNDDAISEEELFGISSTKTFDGVNCSTKHQFILHAALDRYVQMAGPPPGYGWRQNTNADGMFIGLLYPVEEMRVYGYVTTTKVKLLLTVEDDAVPEMQQTVDIEIKVLLRKIHELYIEDLLNPFKDIGSKIVSKTFDEKVTKCISAFNQPDAMI